MMMIAMPEYPSVFGTFVVPVVPKNATQIDRDDLLALYDELADPAKREAAQSCIDEILQECEERR